MFNPNSYPKKPDSYRFSFFEVNADADCYSDTLLKQRTQIIKAREHAGFGNELKKSPFGWFDRDEEALININKDSYLFSAQFKPKMTISREDFYSERSSSVAYIAELNKLEKELSNYLHTYNEQVSDSRLNHPLNFFYLDLKHILARLSSMNDYEDVLKVLPKVIGYITQVEDGLEGIEDFERKAMAHLRLTLKEQIIPKIKNKIETKNSRGSLQTLSKNLQQIIENTQTVLHHLYTVNEVNAHSTQLLTDDLPSEHPLDKEPLHAIKQCSKKSADESIAVKIPNRSEREDVANLIRHLNIKACESVTLIDGLTLNDQQLYLDAIAELYTLTEFYQTIPDIIEMLDLAGEVSTTLLLTSELKNYLQELSHKLETSQVLLREAIGSNERVYVNGLDSSHDKSFLSQVWGKLTSSTNNQEQFKKNKAKLSITGHTEGESLDLYAETKNAINQLISKIDGLSRKHASGELQKQAETLISSLNNRIAHLVPSSQLKLPANSADTIVHAPLLTQSPPPQGASPNGAESSSTQSILLQSCYQGTNEQNMPQTLCVGEDYHAFIFTKNAPFEMLSAPDGLNLHETPHLGDLYNLKSCRPIDYLGGPSVFCEGSETNFIYRPKPQYSVDDFISQTTYQLALGAVFFKMYEWGIEWLTKPPINPVLASPLQASQFISRTSNELNLALENLRDDDDLKFLYDDLKNDLDEICAEHKKGKGLSLPAITELEERIRYFRKSTVKLSQSDVLKAQSEAKRTLIAVSKLSQNEFQRIKQLLNWPNLEQGNAQQARLSAMAEQHNLETESLLALYEHWQLIELLTDNPAPVFESDLIDLETKMIEIEQRLEKGQPLAVSTSFSLARPVLSLNGSPQTLFWQPPGTTNTLPIGEPPRHLHLP